LLLILYWTALLINQLRQQHESLIIATAEWTGSGKPG
jgi:hypothetical protein